MNIALIEPVGAHGGMDYYDFALCKGLKKAGTTVFFYTSKAGISVPKDLYVVESFKGVYGNTPRIVRIMRWLVALWRSLEDAHCKKTDIVHYHFFNSGLLQYIGVFLAKLRGFKVVATIHDVEPFHRSYDLNLAKHLLTSLDGIIVHNEVSKREVDKLFGKRSKRIAIVPHGHYIDFIGQKRAKLTSRRELSLPENHHIFLFFGQIKRVKGLDVAIKALALLRNKIPNVTLLIAGKIWHDSALKYQKLIDELEVANNIVWHSGYVPNEKVDDYYHSCDAVILPYKKIYQSGILLMAMSYGVPIVASNLPGMQELINHGENGLIFDVNDHQALAQELLKIFTNESLAKRLGNHGKEYVILHHDWTEIGKKTAEFYEKVASK